VLVLWKIWTSEEGLLEAKQASKEDSSKETKEEMQLKQVQQQFRYG
jgi:hypothetical protein